MFERVLYGICEGELVINHTKDTCVMSHGPDLGFECYFMLIIYIFLVVCLGNGSGMDLGVVVKTKNDLKWCFPRWDTKHLSGGLESKTHVSKLVKTHPDRICITSMSTIAINITSLYLRTCVWTLHSYFISKLYTWTIHAPIQVRISDNNAFFLHYVSQVVVTFFSSCVFRAAMYSTHNRCILQETLQVTNTLLTRKQAREWKENENKINRR